MEEANPMAKPGLSGKQQKRLDELAKDWEAECKGIFSGFSLSDLHLLLQHFAPLQQLIRQLAVKTPADQTELKAAITKALEKIVERA